MALAENRRMNMRSFVARLMCVVGLSLSASTGVAADRINSDTAYWGWPSGGPVQVLRAFDPPEFNWLSGHRGVDLDIPTGSVVVAPADGVVSYAGVLADRPLVALRISGGGGVDLRTSIEPVDPLVKVGDVVRRGDPIGTALDGHVPSGIHWGVKVGSDRYINPLRMTFGHVRLKPWIGW